MSPPAGAVEKEKVLGKNISHVVDLSMVKSYSDLLGYWQSSSLGYKVPTKDCPMVQVSAYTLFESYFFIYCPLIISWCHQMSLMGYQMSKDRIEYRLNVRVSPLRIFLRGAHNVFHHIYVTGAIICNFYVSFPIE